PSASPSCARTAHGPCAASNRTSPTMEDAVTEHNDATTTPDRPGDGKALLIGLAPAIVGLAGLVVGVVWFNDPAPAAQPPAAQPSAAPSSIAQTPSNQPPTAGAPGDTEVTAEITA